MSPPPGVYGMPGTELPPATNVHQTIHALTGRVSNVERHTAQLVSDVGEIKKYLESIKRYEAWGKHLVSKGILLIIGAVASTYGITRGTAPAPTKETIQMVKSPTTVRVEACTAMQPGPERDKCALDILADLMISKR